ncbi:MAG: tandem-95 repeat protein [Burkholderiales bacterium]|nr:tandem-95 repeat protein [Burkholderiales bacterium]
MQALRAGEIVSDVFAYAASDGITSTPAQLTVTITGTNDAPVTTADAASVGEDGTLATSGNLLANDSDVDTATVLTVAAPGGYVGTYGTLTLTQDGNYNYALANDSAIVQALREGEIVSDVFAYAASDGITSTLATLTVTITGRNDGPVTTADAANVGEDGTLTASGNLLANDSDVDTDTVLTVAAPGGYVGTYGTLAMAQDGSYSYALANDSATVQALRAGEIVSDVFAYAASDGITSTPAQLTVTITGQNDAPVTAADAASVAEDGTLAASGNLLANDSDVDTGTVLTVAAPSTYTGAYGTLTVNNDGWYSYTLANDSPAVQGLRAGQVVADVFVYAATDGIAATPATLTIQITGANDGPQAQGDAGQAREDGGPVAFAADALLANDSDVDIGDSKTLVAVTDSAAGAQVRLIDGQVVYDVASLFQNLKEGETTTDSFTYTMVDGQGATSTATVTMTIVGANDAPVAQDNVATLLEDGRITLALMGKASDVDGDTLTLGIVDQPAHGMLTLNADNTVSYAPAGNWSGEDVFTYRVNDGLADSNIATVRLIVNAVADAPTLVLSERPGATREVFRGSWETATAHDEHSGEHSDDGRPPLVKRNTLESWTLLDGKDHGHDGDDHPDGHCDDGRSEGPEGFELWTSGDKMKNAANKSRVVTAAAGNGTHWLELADAKGEGHQTTGIERKVDAVAGATYTLSLDLAGHLGYSAEYTRIGIYVDGVRIGGAENTSPNDALAWITRDFSFMGTGGAQTIRIVAEPTRRESNGRGMMIDDIALTETLPTNTGREDGTVPLSALGVALTDMDDSEILTLSIAALPVGATLRDGTHSFTASEGATTADVTGWILGNLVLTPPKDFNGSLSLQVIATATEQANGDVAITLADLNVTVLSVERCAARRECELCGGAGR